MLKIIELIIMTNGSYKNITNKIENTNTIRAFICIRGDRIACDTLSVSVAIFLASLSSKNTLNLSPGLGALLNPNI